MPYNPNYLTQLAISKKFGLPPQPTQQPQTQPAWDYKTTQTSPEGDALPAGAKGWRPDGSADFGPGLDGWAKKAYYNIQNAYFKGWNTGEQLVQSNNYQSDVVPRFTSSVEATKAIFGEALWGGLNLLGQFAIGVERVAGTIGFELKDAVYSGRDYTLKENWEASRLTYASIFDWEGSFMQGRLLFRQGDEVRQEMVERMNAGERPDIIAEDMLINGRANPWIEMAGQLIFDPLNADLFLNWFGNGRRALSVSGKVTRELATIENANLAKKLEEGANVTDGIRAAENMQDALSLHRETVLGVQRMEEALRVPGGFTKKVISTLPARAKNYLRFVPESRRLILNNRVAAIAESIVRTEGGDAVAILDDFVAMADSIGDDPLRAAEGFRHMTEFKNPAILLSPAGNELTGVMGHLVKRFGNDWLSSIEAARKVGGVEAVAEVVLGRLHTVMDELYPSAQNILKAADEVKAITKAGGVPSESMAKLAEMAGNMTAIERRVALLHNNLQAGIVGKTNRFFSNLYMNLSTAFPFRNGTQNNLTVFADHGPAAFLHSADFWTDEASKFNGVPLKAEGFGPGHIVHGAALTTPPVKTGYFGVVESLKTMFFKDGKLGIYGRAASEVQETNAAQRIVGYTYKKTFRDALQPLVRSLKKDKRFAGVSDELWGHISSEIFNNYGDVTAALRAVRSNIANGSIDTFKNYDNIPKGLREFFFREGKDRQVITQVLNAPSKDEALKIADSIFNDFDRAAQAAYLDKVHGTPGDPLSDLLKQGEQDGFVDSTRGSLIEAQRHVNNEVISQAVKIVHEVTSDVGFELSKLGQRMDPKLGEMVSNDLWGMDTSENIAGVRNLVIRARDTMTDANYLEKWEQVVSKLPELAKTGTPKTKGEAMRLIWDYFLDDYGPAQWSSARMETLQRVPAWMDEIELRYGIQINPNHRAAMQETIQYADDWSRVSIGEMGILIKDPQLQLAGTRATQIAQLANQYGIHTALESGKTLDEYLLAVINKYGRTEFKSLKDPISLKLVQDAFAAKTGRTVAADVAEKLPVVPSDTDFTRVAQELPASGLTTSEADAANTAVQTEELLPLLPPLPDGQMPTYARALKDSNLQAARQAMLDYVEKNFGRLKTFATDSSTEDVLKLLEPELKKRVEVIRTVSGGVAQEARDFALGNYGEKTTWDLASSYVIPYGFWYKFTYSNAFQRLVYNPALFAHYGKYKDALASQNSGLPDWWKQNIRVDSILGIDLEHPLFFNLEATLNPLNGITGTDFNDPEKVTNWWTYMLNETGKFGPSIWTPINIATGLALRAQGQEEAGNLWVGRILPQSSLIKTWTGMELDPAVAFLMDGYDKYERRRIGRALSQIVLDNPALEQQAIEADRTQSGPLWDQAVQMSNEARRTGQTFSTLFGVGFKGRSEQDMQIDQFDSEWQRLMRLRAGRQLSPEDFKNELAMLKNKYPFMDTVLLSRKSGPDRDLAYAYNVLGRMRPGEANDLLEMVGIQPELVTQFYENNGDMSQWAEGDRLLFMAAMVNLGAIKQIPDMTTRLEWNAARAQYSDMQDAVARDFGSDIQDRINDYYAANDVSTADRRAFMEANPDVSAAMDAQTAYIVNNPLLNTYYGGLDTIARYYASEARAALRAEYGQDIYQTYYQYLDILDPKEKKAFYRVHPELKPFIAKKNDWQNVVNRKTAALAQTLPDLNIPVRDFSSPTQNFLAQKADQPNPYPQLAKEIQGQMSEELQALVFYHIQSGEDLSYEADRALGYIAERYGMSADQALQILMAYQ
jgi:hypothetical protein